MKSRSMQINIIYSMISVIIILASLNNSSLIQLPLMLELLIQFLCYGFCLVYFIENAKLPKSKLLLILIIFLMVLYTCYISKIYTLLSSFVIFLMSTLLDYKKLIKSIFLSVMLVIIIHMFYGLIIFPEYIMYRNTRRFFLGFYSPNSIGTLTLWAFLSFCYLSEFNKKKSSVGFILALIVYYFTNSRSLLLCSTLFYIYVLLFQNKKIVNKFNDFFAKYCVIIFSILFAVLVTLYNSNNPVALKVDDMMTGRLFYSDYAIKNNGYTIIPRVTVDNPIYYKTSYSFSIDIGYVIFLYKYGIIYLLILELIGINISKQKNKYYSALFVIWSIDLCLESFGINFVICFAPIFASRYLSVKNDIDSQGKD